MPKNKQKKYTRRRYKSSKKNMYNKKSHKKRSSKHVQYRGQYSSKGGLDKSNTKQINELKNIIDEYIKLNENNNSKNQKYIKMEKDIEAYKKDIKTKQTTNALTESDLNIIQKLVIQIIDDHFGMDIFTIGIENIYKLINKLVLYFINDVELTETAEFTLKKRITNNMPYLDVIHKKDNYETTYDVNEMFALIESEINKTKYPNAGLDKTVLKKVIFNSKFGLEPVPPMSPSTAS